jgi:alkyl sulfatase BDS1-like metallo-beta-lactamase superfamily hydrolase
MAQSVADIVSAGADDTEASDLGDGIFMSRGTANSYLVTTPGGDVLINTHLPHEAVQAKARFAAVSAGPVKVIVFTQGHPDHVGGWSQWTGPGVETIAQADHPVVREYWRNLHPFYYRRIRRLWPAPSAPDAPPPLPPEPVLTTSFVDNHAFELGGRRFELHAAPEGETTDGLVVWLPQSRTVFTGNLNGPFLGHAPNLYTIRGDKIRSAMRFIRSVDRVLALQPEVLIDGHRLFRGAGEIAAILTRVRDAMIYLRETTIAGMNAGKSVWQLMRDISLPPELDLGQAHGKVSWIVRTIFEEHAGWFRYESTTELYDVPASAIWADLVELAGAGGLTRRAADHAASGRLLEALHLVDMVLASQPDDPAALKLRVMALEQLLERSGGENYSEAQWLKADIAATASRLPS